MAPDTTTALPDNPQYPYQTPQLHTGMGVGNTPGELPRNRKRLVGLDFGWVSRVRWVAPAQPEPGPGDHPQPLPALPDPTLRAEKRKPRFTDE